MKLDELAIPIVQAPLAGGPSTPRLAAAVANAGGLGFLAAGYKRATAVDDEIDELRALTSAPFGVNIFAPPQAPPSAAAIEAYGARLRAAAERYGVTVGEPRHDDDEFEAKVGVVIDRRVAVVSFTFGCPPPEVFERLHAAGAEVWVTVTSPDEARHARDTGADALVVQGYEAGGHRGSFTDGDDREDFGLLALLRLVRAEVDLPLIAAGGIVDGPTVAAVLCAGAGAAQLGSALMLAPEAGTSQAHRAALRSSGRTALTRAFSGRQARGIVNRFMREYGDDAPMAYPDVHHMTTPIRAAAREAGDADALNLWAGQTHVLALEAPAEEIVSRLATDARATIAAVAGVVGAGDASPRGVPPEGRSRLPPEGRSRLPPEGRSR
jgi:nitronate monooxygenase